MKKLGIGMYAWTLGLRSLRQKDCYEFETSIGYIEFIKKKKIYKIPTFLGSGT